MTKNTKPAVTCHECDCAFVALPEGFKVEWVAKSTGIAVGLCQECQEAR